MSFSYDPNLGDDVSKVRFLIGDTTEPAKFSDEAITTWLALNGGNVYLTAALLADSLAATYASRQNLKIDGFSVDYGARADQYRRLAITLRNTAAGGAGALGAPFVGGVSIAAMDAVESDTDRNPSRQTIGGDSFPGTDPADEEWDDARR